MAKNNFYAVKNGKKIGIFDNWKECSEQIHGFSGAIYKGFSTRVEAETYFNGQESKLSKNYKSTEEVLADLEDNEMIAFVDGSNLGDASAFSWGIVTFSQKLGKVDINGSSKDEKFTPHRNVAGELFASVAATKFAIKNNMTKIIIHHDYSGIRHWALSEWKTNNDLSRFYEAFFKQASKLINFEFVKVDGHTGDKFNEEADKLAKAALGIK